MSNQNKIIEKIAVETAYRKRKPNWPFREPSWYEQRNIMLFGAAVLGWILAVGILVICGRGSLIDLNVILIIWLIAGWYFCYYAANSFVRSGETVSQRHFTSIHNLKYVGAALAVVFLLSSALTPMHELAGPFTALVLLLITGLSTVTIQCDIEDARVELANKREYHSKEVDLHLEREDVEGQWYKEACPEPLMCGAVLISCAYFLAGAITIKSGTISNPLFGPSMFFLSLPCGVWVSSTFFSAATYKSIVGEYYERFMPAPEEEEPKDITRDAKAWRERFEAGQRSAE